MMRLLQVVSDLITTLSTESVDNLMFLGFTKARQGIEINQFFIHLDSSSKSSFT